MSIWREINRLNHEMRSNKEELETVIDSGIIEQFGRVVKDPEVDNFDEVASDGELLEILDEEETEIF